MLQKTTLSWIISAVLTIPVAGELCGQDFPYKPVRMVTTAPGGGSDFMARLIAQGLTGSLGQPVIVDNRAAGLIAVETVAKAQRDGYTLLLFANTMWISPFLQRVSYDPNKDFSPVTLAGSSPNVLVVHPSVPVNSVRELIAYAKTRPGQLNYASTGTGSTPHLTAEHLKALAGIDIVHVPYRGSGPALNALIGGDVQLNFAAAASVAPHVKAGRLRALGVTSLEPSQLAPGLPAVAAALPGFESISMFGIWAPAATSAAIVKRLNEEIVRVLGRPDVKEKFLASGIEVVGNSPAEFSATMKSDMVKWGTVIKNVGIRAD